MLLIAMTNFNQSFYGSGDKKKKKKEQMSFKNLRVKYFFK